MLNEEVKACGKREQTRKGKYLNMELVSWLDPELITIEKAQIWIMREIDYCTFDMNLWSDITDISNLSKPSALEVKIL